MEVTLNPLQEKLIKIQSELKAPKNRFNAFGKYNYRDAEGILEAVKPLLAREGVLLTASDKVYTDNGRSYVQATYTLQLGELKIKAKASAREEESKKGMDGSQVTGASSSYARKYALNGMFLIDDTKDSDGTNDGSETKTTKAPACTRKETPATETKAEPDAKKQTVESGTKAFTGAVDWVANSPLMFIEAIEKLRKRYEISDAVEKEINAAVVAKKSGK